MMKDNQHTLSHKWENITQKIGQLLITISFIQRFGVPKLVSFDHDISSFDKNGKEWTGKDATDYLIGKCLDQGLTFPDFFVHTMNTAGRPNIIGSILNYLKHVENKKIDWRYYNSGIINGQII